MRLSGDLLLGEIVSCPDCGKDYVVEKDESGSIILQELNLDGEDFGEQFKRI